MTVNQELVPLEIMGKIELVNLASLRIEPDYQRSEKANRKRIKSQFNPAAAGVLHVGRRADRSMWLIDGQQRRWAMQQLHIKRWHAYVVHSSGPEYEAAVFQMVNGKNRMALSSQELYKAALVAKDPVALAGKRAVEKHGLKMRLSSGGAGSDIGMPLHVTCLGLVYRITKRHGENHTDRVFGLISKTWPQQNKALFDVIPGAVSVLIAWQGDLLDDEIFAEKLCKLPPIKIINDARSGIGHRMANAQAIMVERYNKGMRKADKLKIYKHDSPNMSSVPEMVEGREDEAATS